MNRDYRSAASNAGAVAAGWTTECARGAREGAVGVGSERRRAPQRVLPGPRQPPRLLDRTRPQAASTPSSDSGTPPGPPAPVRPHRTRRPPRTPPLTARTSPDRHRREGENPPAAQFRMRGAAPRHRERPRSAKRQVRPSIGDKAPGWRDRRHSAAGSRPSRIRTQLWSSALLPIGGAAQAIGPVHQLPVGADDQWARGSGTAPIPHRGWPHRECLLLLDVLAAGSSTSCGRVSQRVALPMHPSLAAGVCGQIR